MWLFFVVPSVVSLTLLSLAGLLHWWMPPKRSVSKRCILQSAALSFCNSFLIALAEITIFSGISFRIVQYPFALPPLLDFLVYMLATDFLFYLNHYLLHTSWLFKHVHSWHHKVIYPTAFDFAAVHPVEMLQQYLCLYIAPSFLPICDTHIRIYGVMMAFAPVFEHGTGLNHIPLNWIYDPEFHNLHHLYYRYNYGVGLLGLLYDRIFDTHFKRESQ